MRNGGGGDDDDAEIAVWETDARRAVWAGRGEIFFGVSIGLSSRCKKGRKRPEKVFGIKKKCTKSDTLRR